MNLFTENNSNNKLWRMMCLGTPIDGRLARTMLSLCVLAMLQAWSLVPGGVLGFDSVMVGQVSPMVPKSRRLLPRRTTTTELALVPAELVSDVVTSGFINAISDCVAQFLESFTDSTAGTSDKQVIFEDDTAAITNDHNDEESVSYFALLPSSFYYDALRTQRLAVFGLADGVVSHVWFLGLDSIVGEGQALLDTVMKTAADSLIYTPVWCAWFLAFMTLLEDNESNEKTMNNLSPETNNFAAKLESIPNVLRSDWRDLLIGNLGFFLPITGAIYGIVPREERVLTFGVAGLIYTTILSIWNQSRSSGSESPQPPVQ